MTASKGPRLRRRVFLAAGMSAAIACRRGQRGAGWRFFTSAEADTADAICAQFIPADRDPGAKEAAVVNYIDVQLSGKFRRHQATYRQGLAAIDVLSATKFGHRFSELTSPQQLGILTTLPKSERKFFELILAHSLQGFYGDPRHGGNRNMVSWKMVGLPFPPVRGRMRYDQPKEG